MPRKNEVTAYFSGKQLLSPFGLLRGRVRKPSAAIDNIKIIISSGRLCNSYNAGPVLSYKLRYIVGFSLVDMAISTNQKPTV